ncbi:leucine-rich repeat protein [Skeletonema marinoi]|uniref:Leucine-rich repeat protein n=1 Tax=Skeletonema marinoi TaxID=267567 RepID=A0AAD9DHK7_9STRA|nr:leucine-rich repeat protein [Skeletonema marinoi]
MSSSESEHEDGSVGSRSVEEEFDEEAWREELRLSKLRIARAKYTNLFRQVKGNDPTLTELRMCGELNVRYLNMNNYGLERLGEVIAGNNHLVELCFDDGSLDDQKMSSLFRGLTRSSSIKDMNFDANGLTVVGVRSMVPFLQNSNNLLRLNLNDNNLQSGGFNELFHALRNSPIESLHCGGCGIDSIEIEKNAFPKKIERLYLHDNEFGVDDIRGLVMFLQNSNDLSSLDISGNNVTSEGFGLLLREMKLSDSPIQALFCDSCDLDSIKIDDAFIPTRLKSLNLCDNSINADGCCEIAKLLQARSSSLSELSLECNKFVDEGVAILASALQNNATLKSLNMHNDAEEITIEGLKMLLELVNDMSSINGTLQSNHTLKYLELSPYKVDDTDLIRQQIDNALEINCEYEDNPAAAGKEKVIQTQLNSQKRSELCHQLGIGQRMLFSEIKPIHLPEVLALISRHHGQGELYAALVPSIAALFSTMNKKQCLQQQRAYYAAKLEAIEAEIAAIEAADDIQ